ncbi:MAG: hypothetical protein M9953_03360 [Thermomicrobiales bacterium]|nr:hypothetical protein [Thermomicrobiales bacterium]
MSKIKAIVFDQGETLINETRFWASVAAYAGVPELTVFGVLGGLIERRVRTIAASSISCRRNRSIPVSSATN